LTKRFRKYTEGKGLILSSKKSKVIVFKRGRICSGEKVWKWEGRKNRRCEGNEKSVIYYTKERRS